MFLECRCLVIRVPSSFVVYYQLTETTSCGLSFLGYSDSISSRSPHAIDCSPSFHAISTTEHSYTMSEGPSTDMGKAPSSEEKVLESLLDTPCFQGCDLDKPFCISGPPLTTHLHNGDCSSLCF